MVMDVIVFFVVILFSRQIFCFVLTISYLFREEKGLHKTTGDDENVTVKNEKSGKMMPGFVAVLFQISINISVTSNIFYI